MLVRATDAVFSLSRAHSNSAKLTKNSVSYNVNIVLRPLLIYDDITYMNKVNARINHA